MCVIRSQSSEYNVFQELVSAQARCLPLAQPPLRVLDHSWPCSATQLLHSMGHPSCDAVHTMRPAWLTGTTPQPAGSVWEGSGGWQ